MDTKRGAGAQTSAAQNAQRWQTLSNLSTAYFINPISLGRQVWLIHGSSGPYIRRIVNQLLPGIVWSQLPSLPPGGFGAK